MKDCLDFSIRQDGTDLLVGDGFGEGLSHGATDAIGSGEGIALITKEW